MEVKQDVKPANSAQLIQALTTERDSLDESFVNARKLLAEAIENAKSDKKNGISDDKLISVVPPTPSQVAARVRIPEKDHPKFNFVGKLLGPKGSTLKQLQLDTGTRMSILGRNSMRDKAKEEEQRNSGDPQYAHLHKDLHVLIEAYCPGPEAYSRVGHALTEMKKFLTPDPNDDIRQGQLMEMGMSGPPSSRGGMGRGRGAPSRGMARPLGGAPRGRAPPRGASRGGIRGRGAPPGRGRAAPRQMGYQQEEEYYDDGYGATSYEDGAYDESYGEGVADDGSYGYGDGGAGDGYQSYDYGGYGSSAQSSGSQSGSYGGYGSSGNSWSSGSGGAGRPQMKAPTQYGQKPTSRAHPYRY